MDRSTVLQVSHHRDLGNRGVKVIPRQGNTTYILCKYKHSNQGLPWKRDRVTNGESVDGADLLSYCEDVEEGLSWVFAYSVSSVDDGAADYTTGSLEMGGGRDLFICIK